MRVAKALGVLASIPIAIAALLFWQHRQAVTLPAPTGPYAVGRADHDWIDRNRLDPIADEKGSFRELTVWIWYPAAATSSPGVQYMPAPLRVALERHMGVILTRFLTRDLSLVRPHAIAGASLSPDSKKYPVLLLKPGIGALALDYTTLAEDLASHGYVVVGSDSPHSTTVVVYQDGRIARRTAAGRPAKGHAFDDLAKVWADDDRFLLDQLALMPAWRDKLDFQSVGAFGHSFGGAASLRFCSDEPRCKAAVDLDGALHGDAEPATNKPLLFFLSGQANSSAPEVQPIVSKIRSIANRLPNRPSFLTLAGSELQK